MKYFDPESFSRNAGAAEMAFDAIRGLLGIFKEAKDLLPEDKREAAALAIESSTKQLAVAEAEVARVLGYELCHCVFPPTVMVAVGYQTSTGLRIYECSKCGYNTAGRNQFTRLRYVTAK
ncbi:hypothetical protein [Sinorhizobium fredii]|uniref:Uncharacterized protein n=1 Tax=Rhizobium fredii TaxID=380 RepID=A0A2A6M731_RHIFR|nr:hypothetical protein [Sinorhizobium fredii]PDT50418.1 hypothetical protein CO661_01925 [Sinorhizobium fredii]